MVKEHTKLMYKGQPVMWIQREKKVAKNKARGKWLNEDI